MTRAYVRIQRYCLCDGVFIKFLTVESFLASNHLDSGKRERNEKKNIFDYSCFQMAQIAYILPFQCESWIYKVKMTSGSSGPIRH